MEVKLHPSVEDFRGPAEAVYRRDPIRHTLELSMLGADSLYDDSVLLTIWDGSQPIGAALQTPPYPLVCNGIPIETIDAVVAQLSVSAPELRGVRGMRSTARRFAESWGRVTGRQARVHTTERLYRLGELRAPSDVSGAFRLATADDYTLLVRWVGEFLGEAFGQVPEDGGVELVDTAGRLGNRFVLWVADGAPVSMAMLRVPAFGVSRIGPVYTPADQRRNGFGSAVTAAAAQLAHDSGTPDVVLFADLANPTSNAIYQQIGFVAVHDSVRIDFSARVGEPPTDTDRVP
jgi:hypothetical protein